MKNQQNQPKPGSLKAGKAKWGYIFLLPWFLIFSVFYAYPLGYGIVISFTNATLGSAKFIGIGNYINIFKDQNFWRSLIAMFEYTLIMLPFSVLLPLYFANVLRHHSRGFNVAAKLLAYMPAVTCAVALVLSWKYLFDPNFGAIKSFLSIFGVKKFSIFDEPKYAIPVMSVMAASTSLGTNLIIYCAALDGIPKDYYEAAELDGASRWRQFVSITIPLLNPTVVYVFITSTIAALQIFVIPQLMTGGGPNFKTSTLLLLIYNTAFGNNQFGYASAIGVILFLITAVIAVVQFKVTSKDKIEY